MTEQIVTNRTTVLKPERYLTDGIEMLRCEESPHYFIENYVKVYHPVRGLVSLKPYPVQAHLLGEFMDYRYNIVCDSRQTGTSAITAAYILHRLLFKKDQDIIVLSDKYVDAKELIRVVMLMIQELPPWAELDSLLRRNTKMVLELRNGNRLQSQAVSESVLRGYSPSLVVCNDFAYITPRLQDMLWEQLRIVGSTGTDILIMSVPGLHPDDLFSRLWSQICSSFFLGGLMFNPTVIPWYSVPDRDYEFKTRNLALMEEDQWKREYECKFV